MADPIALADREIERWKAHWERNSRFGMPSPPTEEEKSRMPTLPTIPVECARRVVRSFRQYNGVGADLVPPKLFDVLSEVGLGIILMLLYAIERTLCWPSAVLINMLIRIPKPDGGTRLIGILASIVRIWGRLRRSLSAQWEGDYAHTAFWGGVGKSSVAAAFDHDLAGEIARTEGKYTGSAFFDQEKCYELVPLALLWREAKEMGFPLRVAWLCIIIYAGERVISAYGSYSVTVRTVCGITAGCTHATTCLLYTSPSPRD